ncbi:hypothetical protein Btru_047846 [Bulinus truncatus]|nr:hypothetical protein Btru_047846 [Bulinus truncatus]
MDIVVAIIKPKPGHISSTYKPHHYEILLLDSKSPPGERVKLSKYLPMLSLNTLDEEPREVVLTQVYKLIGIKGDRALLVQWNRDIHANHRGSLSQFSLYFVPVGLNEKIGKKFVEQGQNSPSFHPLEYVLDALENNTVHFPSPTRLFLLQLESWLKEKHQRPTAIERLFQQKAEFRIHLTIHNPAFIPSRITPEVEGIGSGKVAHVSQEIVKNANEALAKMLSIEKCDSVVINPLFGSLLPYKTKPNTYVINQHWPNVPNFQQHPQTGFSKNRWRNTYPLHYYAAQGEKTEVEILLKQGYNHSMLDSVGFAPIHYAAKYDYFSVVEALLIGGCSPNLADISKTTALHMAARRGSVQLAKCLLQRPDIDLDIRDKDGKRALDICMSVSNRTANHEQVELLIKEASKRPSYTVEVFLMDNTSKNLKLVSGFRTTVQQLNEVLMKEFNFPQNYWDIFTLWIGSRSLELQLKLDHEVVRELQQWNTRCVSMLTDRKNPSEEEPLLTWRRNVKVSVEKEKHQLQHPKALDLLFYEARHNYINGLYPCKGKDTINFATILFALQHFGTTNIKSVLANLSQTQLKKLIPDILLRSKDASYWLNKISKTYASFKDTPQQQLKLQFLAACQRLTVYGSAFFTGKISNPLTQCYIGVNDIGIHMISMQTKKMIHSLEYREITWRHIQEKTLLEIKVLRSAHGTIEIRTRQAGLIDHLMQQLDRMHNRDCVVGITPPNSSQVPHLNLGQLVGLEPTFTPGLGQISWFLTKDETHDSQVDNNWLWAQSDCPHVRQLAVGPIRLSPCQTTGCGPNQIVPCQTTGCGPNQIVPCQTTCCGPNQIVPCQTTGCGPNQSVPMSDNWLWAQSDCPMSENWLWAQSDCPMSDNWLWAQSECPHVRQLAVGPIRLSHVRQLAVGSQLLNNKMNNFHPVSLDAL